MKARLRIYRHLPWSGEVPAERNRHVTYFGFSRRGVPRLIGALFHGASGRVCARQSPSCPCMAHLDCIPLGN